MDSIASLFFSLILSIPLANATSFGPINITEQVRTNQYFVRGRILGKGVPAMAPKLNRPYTYWKLSVTEQQLGPTLPSQIDIRGPGGEIGEMGYRVSGAASFREDEEVFVALRDTDEGEVKEISGLSSGKYTVSEDGKTVTSGLGMPVRGSDGMPLSAEEFSQVLRRAASGRESPKDKNIFVNKGADSHAHAGAQEPEAVSEDRLDSSSTSTATSHAPKEPSDPKSFKNSEPEPEKFSTGTSGFWILALIASAALAAFLIFRRR